MKVSFVLCIMLMMLVQGKILLESAQHSEAAPLFGDNIHVFNFRPLISECITQTRCNFFKEKNKILVGYSTAVIAAANVFDCHSQCIDSMSKFKFECRSGMFYPQVKLIYDIS